MGVLCFWLLVNIDNHDLDENSLLAEVKEFNQDWKERNTHKMRLFRIAVI